MKAILFGLLLSTSALANISGNWLGQGEWTYQGSGTHCFMQLSFEDSSTTFKREAGYFDCDMVGLDISALELKKVGTKLIDENGNQIGSYIGNKIELNEMYDDNVKVHSVLTVDGLHFDYDETWYDSKGDELYQITGRLFTNR